MDDGNLAMFSEADVDTTVLDDVVELLVKAKVVGGTTTLLDCLCSVSGMQHFVKPIGYSSFFPMVNKC